MLLARHDAEIRPAVQQRRAERLAFGYRYVGTKVARPLEQAEANRVKRLDQERTGIVRDLRNGRYIFQAAEEIGMLQQNTSRLAIDRGRHARRFCGAVWRRNRD